MKAFVVEHYGKGGLRAAEVPEPEVGDGDVLVKVSAAGINPLDKMIRDGEFKRLLKYKTPFVLGHDVAGVVTRVGSAVRDFQVGDEVYARPRDLRIGTFAEYVAIDQDDVALKPASLTLHEAAAVPLVTRKVRKQAGRLGVSHSFLFMRAEVAGVVERGQLAQLRAVCLRTSRRCGR